MQLKCVLTATNDNELYSDFIPIFIESYKKLMPEVLVRIIFVGEKIPEKYNKYSDNLILFTQPSWISSAFVSQYIRLLYPAILKIDGGIMITDIDMIPMNRDYYIDSISDVDDSMFFCYRDVMHLDCCQIPMCYNIATADTWSKVFHIKNLEDIEQRLNIVDYKINYEERHGGLGWSTDQEHLFLSINKYENENNKKIFIYKTDAETKFNRLCRDDGVSRSLPQNVLDNIKNHKYTDYHLNRPMSEYDSLNWKIFSLL